MNKVKIVSNPYEKKVIFERWSDQFNSWVTIDQDTNGLVTNFSLVFFRLKCMKL